MTTDQIVEKMAKKAKGYKICDVPLIFLDSIDSKDIAKDMFSTIREDLVDMCQVCPVCLGCREFNVFKKSKNMILPTDEKEKCNKCKGKGIVLKEDYDQANH